MTTGDSPPQRTAPPEPASEGDVLDQEHPVAPGPEPTGGPRDPEAPEADALDQAREVVPGERTVTEPPSPEANEADVWEQSLEVPLDDEDRRE